MAPLAPVIARAVLEGNGAAINDEYDPAKVRSQARKLASSQARK
jgi:hypothetical protein